MPFNTEAIRKLRRRQDWSIDDFHREFNKFLSETVPYDSDGIERFSLDGTKFSYTIQALKNWEDGIARPKVRDLDSLYRFVGKLGHVDLDFYVRPIIRIDKPVNGSSKITHNYDFEI